MVKKGETGVPRSSETRVKIGIGARNTRLAEKALCPHGCGKSFNRGNLVTHVGKHHTFVCKVLGCLNDGSGKTGFGYCGPHYRLHAFCVKVGITIDLYFDAYRLQDGKCKICSKPGELQRTGAKSKLDVLVIDHCHESGEFRGLLCYGCNLALGHFGDNPQSLERAVDYLKGTL